MNDIINVLIVEDQPLIINSLKSALEHISNAGTFKFNVKSARDCDSAQLHIDKAVKGTPFDLILLDINIPPSSDRTLLSGEDVGIELKGLFPEIKIIIFTSHHENYRLNNILQSVKPNGLLIKSDIDFIDLIESINDVLNDIPHYSKAVLKLIRSHISNDFVLDKTDRKLLFLLSKGTKTKDLPTYIGLSKGGIERRKRNLKDVFCLENEDDSVLLEVAKEKGFI